MFNNTTENRLPNILPLTTVRQTNRHTEWLNLIGMHREIDIVK